MEIGVKGIENLLGTSVGKKKILKKHFSISLYLRINKINLILELFKALHMKHKVVNSTYTTSHELSLLEFDSGCSKLPSRRCGFYEFVA